jgi:hypothetical protein
VTLTALAFADYSTLALPRLAQLTHQTALLQLGERTGDLPHGDLHLVVGGGEVIAARGHDVHATLGERDDAEFLRQQLARKAAGILDQHRANTIALDAVEQRGKAGAALDGVVARKPPDRRTSRPLRSRSPRVWRGLLDSQSSLATITTTSTSSRTFGGKETVQRRVKLVLRLARHRIE